MKIKSNRGSSDVLFFISVMLMILFFLLGNTLGRIHQQNITLVEARIEAVKQGHAHWEVKENGETIFVWNKSCKEKN